jgi:SNF2 family DNA or RNA helicase
LKTGIPGLLPPKKQYIRRLEFTDDQRQLYDSVKNELIKGSVASRSKNGVSNTFQMIMKLRQICDHGEELLSVSSSNSASSLSICCRQCSKALDSCLEELEALATQKCAKHALCGKCSENDVVFLEEEDPQEEAECKECILLQFGSESNQYFSVYTGPSAKVKALLSAIDKDKASTTRNGGPVKQ